MIQKSTHRIDNSDGWKLGLHRMVDDERHNRDYRPVLLVPGYGMNTFILGYHPAGRSLMEYLAEAGFEVWALCYRAMDGAVCQGGSTDYGMKEISLTDMGVALDYVAAECDARAERVDVIGCSLGGSMVYAHLALVRDNHIGSVVALGAPLRWVEINPVLRAMFSSSWLASRVRIKHMRKVAGVLLPALKYAPFLLNIYVHPKIVDMSKASTLVETVEDPNPVLNEEIVRWMKDGDLTIDGCNVTGALRSMTNPLLVLTGNADGVVPIATARFVLDWVASERKDFALVGDRDKRFAHADLYVSRYSQEMVFAPIAEWLASNYV